MPSEETFSRIAGNIPKEAKFGMIKGMVSEHAAEALSWIKDEIFVAGFKEMDIKSLESGNPDEYTRLLSLAYGLTLYKSEGFLAAMDLIRAGEVLRKAEAPKALPAMYFIATTAMMHMADKGIVSRRSALYMLGVMINDADTKPMEKAMFLELSVHIDPRSICSFKDSKIPDVKIIAEARFEEMQGQVDCGK